MKFYITRKTTMGELYLLNGLGLVTIKEIKDQLNFFKHMIKVRDRIIKNSML